MKQWRTNALNMVMTHYKHSVIIILITAGDRSKDEKRKTEKC